jgi:squalene-hopene/tetraprenyl-beta-curcumene cyclase
VVGLRKVGIESSDPMLLRADLWIKQCQNPDGGFGESFLTYEKPKLKCRGQSSASQTAWALMALLETNPWYHPAIQRAVSFLEKTYSPEWGWIDSTINGTGQPVATPMQYPVYAKVFPALALKRYLVLAAAGQQSQ